MHARDVILTQSNIIIVSLYTRCTAFFTRDVPFTDLMMMKLSILACAEKKLEI